MDRGRVTERGIWAARGGRGERLLVLLHGMGANAGVWERLLPLIEGAWSGRWLAPRELAGRPAPVFATREEATARSLRISGLAGLAEASSATAAAA